MGPQWDKQPPEKRQEFARDFSKLLFSAYIGDIEKYANQEITYSEKQVAPDYAVVEAHARDRSGPVTLNYALHLVNGNWRVYDVSVQGISLVVNYRSQFDSMLANGSFDNLLMRLKQKVARVCGNNAC